jgi:hypothetical protein
LHGVREYGWHVVAQRIARIIICPEHGAAKAALEHALEELGREPLDMRMYPSRQLGENERFAIVQSPKGGALDVARAVTVGALLPVPEMRIPQIERRSMAG